MHVVGIRQDRLALAKVARTGQRLPQLQLTSIRHEFTETGRPSDQGQMTCRDLLTELLMTEYGNRARRICP
ncbi:hypothetical protein B1H19_35300 [Streptomyces gilvosporeus]|uniref:Uncharacterized protein n=2 Tax=Streptomyces gilvosporeus TaxID=553510 RepID=A0A1V0U0L1_9ACTN|nr:hypothetical protein B1H19_35300 [Streptomyces gilvosporeus]